MKRNKQSSKVMRRRSTTATPGTASKYARKKAAGKQMYGPGCCAHDQKH